DEMYASRNDSQRDEIRVLKKDLNIVAKQLGDLWYKGEQHGPKNFALEVVKKLQIGVNRRRWLRELLGLSSDDRQQTIRRTIPLPMIQEVADFVIDEYKKVTIKAADEITTYLDPENAKVKTKTARALRVRMKQYFEDYEYYDQVIFPI